MHFNFIAYIPFKNTHTRPLLSLFSHLLYVNASVLIHYLLIS